MNIPRTLASGAALLAVSSLALTGCASEAQNPQQQKPTTDTKTEISWTAILHAATPPEPGNPVEAAIEKKTGVDLDIQWVPDAVREEKLNAALASDKLTDITMLPRVDNTSIRRALTSGQFWDVEPYLKDYPNLAAIDPQTIESAKIDGHLYGVPIQKAKARYGVLVRQDWLDNLGLEVPHTIEELSEVARAFSHDDPDGNGKDDTYGFLDRFESFTLGFGTLAGYFGAGTRFEFNDDGEIISSYDTDAMKEAMEWYRGLYEDGAINPDFPTLQKPQHMERFGIGDGGIFIGTLNTGSGFINLASDIDPGSPMEWTAINDITYKDVPRSIITDTNGGLGGWHAISTSTVKTEEDLAVVLQFLNDLLDEEAFSLMTNGIEGEHFNFTPEGYVEVIEQDSMGAGVEIFRPLRLSEIVTTYPSTIESDNIANALIADNADYAVVNVAQSLSSATFDTRWTEFVQSANDAYTKYMVGQIDMDGYQAAIDKVRSSGLGLVEQEFNESYNELKK